MAPVPVINLERELDRLFQAPFAEFVGTRNGLASQLKKAGRAEESARVRGLAKPTYTAWLVNQLYWNARDELDAYLKAADRVRELEAALLEGKKAIGQAEALAARTAALDGLMSRAAAKAVDEGAPLSPALSERLRTTLEAIGAFGSAAAKHQRGRLQEDLDPPGFAAFASLAAGRTAAPSGSRRAAPAPPPLRIVSRGPGSAEARRAAEDARARLQELQTAAARAQDAANAAQDAERKARAAQEAARGRLEEAERTLQSARAEVDATAAALKSRQADARKAAAAAAAAQKALEREKRKRT